MQEKYKKWIEDNVTEAYGKCAEVTAAMVAAFPELTRVRGHYYCYGWGERTHWWLTAPDGSIVDPTKDQFPSKGNGEYVPLPANAPEPTGKCPNCGELIYNGGDFCDDHCGHAYVAFIHASLR